MEAIADVIQLPAYSFCQATQENARAGPAPCLQTGTAAFSAHIIHPTGLVQLLEIIMWLRLNIFYRQKQ